jgi:hypothetical protein
MTVIYRVSQPNDGGVMAIDLVNLEDIVPAIAANGLGRFHLDVITGAGEFLPSGHSARRYRFGLHHPDGSVELEVDPESTPVAD